MTHFSKRRQFLRAIPLSLLCAASTAALLPGAASAQAAYPSKPIIMVVPFPPGGPTDLVARVLAQKVGEQLGTTIIVDNRPGANSNLGAALVARANADGYTILYNTSAVTLSPSLYKSMAYDVQRDLAPVVLTAVVPLALVVPESLPVNNVKEFIAYGLANPGKMSYGSAGNGNVTHLAAFQLARTTGIQATHIPYKGSAPADVDLVAGQTQFMTETVNSIMSFVREKRLKMLAVTTPKRIALFPDVPTLAEAGVAESNAGAWQGIMVPARTPKAIVDRLNAEVMKALKDPDVRARLAAQGTEPLGSTPQEYGDYLKSELARWSGVVKETGISLD